ncbi:MAG: hypothetical protein EOP58_01355 [Sphingomonadales bacterium]|nr:MAG: hypothetical protein EOP58_01355 [Sphingomonadales bacterium]
MIPIEALRTGGPILETSLMLMAVGAVITLALAVLYRAIWFLLRDRERTPSGFGLLLAPAMLVAGCVAGVSAPLLISLGIITVATLAYWLDDILELSARSRVAIAIVAGALVGAIYPVMAGYSPLVIVALAVAAAIVNVLLVSMVNFQDGADLNLATLIVLTAALLFAYAPHAREWVPLALACLAFTLPFAMLNARPATIYFGDSGSFAFAMLFVVMALAFLVGPVMPPPEAAIPSALAVVDTAVVTLWRIKIRQPFTTRHYFHLYQRLQRYQPGFAYLLPQFVNAALCIALAQLLQLAGIPRFWSVAAAMVVVTIPLFFAWRKWFAAGEPGPPLARGATK